MKSKDIIKELIIFLLLALAIILVLGVLLYGYMPSNKIIPEKVSYTTPEEIKEELQTDNSVDNEEVVVTYKIDSTELNNYKRIKEYNSGRKNPFGSVNDNTVADENSTTNTGTSTNGGQSSSTNGNSGTTTPNTSNKESSGSNSKETTQSSTQSSGYLPDKGTK